MIINLDGDTIDLNEFDGFDLDGHEMTAGEICEKARDEDTRLTDLDLASLAGYLADLETGGRLGYPFLGWLGRVVRMEPRPGEIRPVGLDIVSDKPEDPFTVLETGPTLTSDVRHNSLVTDDVTVPESDDAPLDRHEIALLRSVLQVARGEIYIAGSRLIEANLLIDRLERDWTD